MMCVVGFMRCSWTIPFDEVKLVAPQEEIMSCTPAIKFGLSTEHRLRIERINNAMEVRIAPHDLDGFLNAVAKFATPSMVMRAV